MSDPLRMPSTLDKLNGRHILILGNHDEIKPFHYEKIGFTFVATSFIIELNEFGRLWKVAIAHDPHRRNDFPEDFIFLCGHIHDLFKVIREKKTVNIGVDVWNFYPTNFSSILKLL